MVYGILSYNFICYHLVHLLFDVLQISLYRALLLFYLAHLLYHLGSTIAYRSANILFDV